MCHRQTQVNSRSLDLSFQMVSWAPGPWASCFASFNVLICILMTKNILMTNIPKSLKCLSCLFHAFMYKDGFCVDAWVPVFFLSWDIHDQMTWICTRCVDITNFCDAYHTWKVNTLPYKCSWPSQSRKMDAIYRNLECEVNYWLITTISLWLSLLNKRMCSLRKYREGKPHLFPGCWCAYPIYNMTEHDDLSPEQNPLFVPVRLVS